jgi:hypothetical protein
MSVPAAPDVTRTVPVDRRLRIGGWAALLGAILAPTRLAALFASSGEPLPFAAPAFLVLDILVLLATAGAIVGLAGLFAPLATDRWPTISAVVVGGLGLAVAIDLLTLAGTAQTAPVVIARLVGDALGAAWFTGAGLILMAGGRQLARVGWTATLGGLGMLVSAIAVATSFGGPVGTGRSWIDWFELVSLFVVVSLVRIWSYVVRGRLPGPGIL